MGWPFCWFSMKRCQNFVTNVGIYRECLDTRAACSTESAAKEFNYGETFNKHLRGP